MSGKTKRIQFDFDVKAAARLDELTGVLGASSRAEVVRRALALLDVVSNAQQAGESIYIKSKDGQLREVIIV